MTSVDIEALERLSEAATPGPWRTADGGLCARATKTMDLRDDIVIDCSQRAYLEDNLRMLVAMRNALPAILAELRLARKVVDASRDMQYHASAAGAALSRALRAYDAAVGEVPR